MGVEFVISMIDRSSDKLDAIARSFARTKSSAEELARSASSKLGDGMGAAMGKLGSGFDSLSGKMSGMASGFKDSLSSIPGIGMLLNPITAVTAGVGALIAGVSKLGAMSQEWELGLAKINVTAQLSKQQLTDLGGKFREIAGRVPVDLEKIPEAYNKIISSGLSVNESMKALEPTLLAAKAGFADTAVVAQAGTRIMIATGLEVTTVYDKLFATLNKGNAEFADIAQYLPRVIPAAQALGTSFDDIAGSFATLTKTMSAEQAATSLQNMFVALGKSNIRKNLADIGVQVFDSSGKMRGMTEIVRDLNDQMTGLTDEAKALKFTKLGFDQEAVTGFGSLSNTLADLDTNIRFVANSSGELQKAVENSTTSADRETQAWNNFKNALAPVGELFVDLKITILEFVTEFQSPFDFLWSKIKKGSSWVFASIKEDFEKLKSYLTKALDFVTESKFGQFMGINKDNKYDQYLDKVKKENEARKKINEVAGGIPVPAGYMPSEFSPNLMSSMSGVVKDKGKPFDLFNGSLVNNPVKQSAPIKQTETAQGTSASSVAAGGTRNTQVTINVGKLVETIAFNGTVQENVDSLTAQVRDALIRVLYTVETA